MEEVIILKNMERWKVILPLNFWVHPVFSVQCSRSQSYNHLGMEITLLSLMLTVVNRATCVSKVIFMPVCKIWLWGISVSFGGRDCTYLYLVKHSHIVGTSNKSVVGYPASTPRPPGKGKKIWVLRIGARTGGEGGAAMPLAWSSFHHIQRLQFGLMPLSTPTIWIVSAPWAFCSSF